ncbi:mitochondrial amidoxime-reducing component 1 [Nilaparvata lugens]|uniref:mitochondrial amidoxime-reducing component 1 n=1 Tax=Nilaparvata lugens TaxID=108931 RepID=UPI00193E60A4|nr:mitochondrial amidoxime-reducing component 1 [Nilaparvata lugens]
MVEYKAVLNSSQVIIGCAVVAAIATNLYMWLQYKKKSKMPKKWISVGKISNLIMYPLKSAAGVQITSAECTVRGMKDKSSDDNSVMLQDRSFMVYNEKTGNFLTAKGDKKLLQICVKSGSKNSIVLSSPETEDVEVKMPSENGKVSKCVMYAEEQVNVVDCGDEAADWLRRYFGKDGDWRLGYYVSDQIANRKPTDSNWTKYTGVYNKLRKEDLGAFSDIASYMILTEESLKELNDRLEPNNQVTYKNFRPNIMVSTSQTAFAEDNWDWIKIGDNVIMRQVKPCTRCVVITMNPSNGIYNKEREPLKTLESFRQVTDPEQKKLEGKSPVFGQYFGIHNLGSISVGDTVYIGSN